MPPKASKQIERYLKRIKTKTNKLLHRHKAKTLINRQPMLQQTIQMILERHDIILKPADKNYGPTIIDRTNYISAGETLLADTITYQHMDTPPNIMSIKTTLTTILRTHKHIYYKKPDDEHETYTALARTILRPFTTNQYQYARLYLCPKIHKETNPNEWIKQQWRQICASIGWVTYETSTYLDIILQPIMQKIPTYLKDSATLIKQLNIQEFPADCWLLEADVDNMYPSINISHALHALETYLTRNNHNLEEPIQAIIPLAHWVLTNNYIEFNDKIYLQIKGTAIGTPFAVTFACIYMAEIEKQTFETMIYSSIKLPMFLKRYIDDVLGIFRTETQATIYIEIINTIAPDIHLTAKISNTRATFLDTQIYKGPLMHTKHKLDTELYQKPTNQYLFIPPNSYHNPKIFTGWITGYLKRIRINCTQDDRHVEHKHNFYNRLIARGYTPTFLDPLFNTTIQRKTLLRNINKHKVNKHKSPPLILKLPYNPRTMRIYKQLQKIHTPSQQTIDSSLVLTHIFKKRRRPLTCYRRAKNLGDIFVKAKVEHQENNNNHN